MQREDGYYWVRQSMDEGFVREDDPDDWEPAELRAGRWHVLNAMGPEEEDRFSEEYEIGPRLISPGSVDNRVLDLVARFFVHARANFPEGSDERLRKFTLDYLKQKGPRLMELVSEEMLWPGQPPISPGVLAESPSQTLAILRGGDSGVATPIRPEIGEG